jgi:hypothetical protein
VSEIQLGMADIVPAGTYNFSIHLSTSPTEGSWSGDFTFDRDTTAAQAAHTIARFVLDTSDCDDDRGRAYSVNWLFLDQDGPDWLHLDMKAATR